MIAIRVNIRELHVINVVYFLRWNVVHIVRFQLRLGLLLLCSWLRYYDTWNNLWHFLNRRFSMEIEKRYRGNWKALADFQTKRDGRWKMENEDRNVYLLACCCWNGGVHKRVWTVQRLQDNYMITYISHFDRTMDIKIHMTYVSG